MRTRFEKVLLAAGLVLAATGAVRAQRSGHHDAAGIQAALLTNKSVQKELKLDVAQSEKIKTLAKHVAAKGRAAVAEYKDLPESERREKMHELMTATCAEAMTTLRGDLTAEQFKRYEQIVLQQRGIMAFADPEIQRTLKLTDVQKDGLHNLAKVFHGQMRELSQSVSPANMAEVHAQGMALQRKALDNAVAALSAEQKATWKELVGEYFEVKFEGHPADVTR